MFENSRFLRGNLESPSFLIEAAEKPKVKAGGSSSSDVLNRWGQAVSQDLALLAVRSNIVATRNQRVTDMIGAIGGSLSSLLASLESRIDAVEDAVEILADMHTDIYFDAANSNCEINTLFGQVTLPRLAVTSLLTQEDIDGRLYVSPEVEITYSYLANPTTFDFQPAPEAIHMLRQEQAWLLDSTSASHIWVKLKAPLQYRGLTPNVLEIYPLPPFGMDLLEVSYQKAGTSFTSTWYSLDVSYLPGYNSSTGRVERVGPVRIHMPGDPVSQIRMHFVPRAATAWGLEALNVHHVQYDSRATLAVADPYSRTVGDILLRGKDPSDLAALTVGLSGNEAQIDLKTSDASQTPVITGVILKV